ncbi:MAG: OmpA family protein [Nitrospira sp.]|nr:OmpA family protein [Nitrospira sp.]
MIIRLSAFALVSIVMLCGNIPVSMAVEDSDGQSSQDELSVARNQLQQAKHKIDELERQLKQRIGELVLQLHAKDNELAALITSGHETSKQLRDDLASQTEEFNKAKRRIAELEQQLASAGKGQELAQAKRRVAEVEQQMAKKEQELAQAKRRVAEVEQQMAKKEQEPAQAKARGAETEQQPARKEQELAQAKHRVTEVEQQMAGKEQELAQAKRRVTDAEQQIVGKELELAQAKRRVTETELQMAEKEHELAQTKRRAAEVDQQMAGKEQDLTQAKRRVTEAEQQTVGKEQELTQVKRRVTDAEQQIAGKELELAQAKRRTAEAEQQTAKKDQELAQVKEDLKQASQKLADLNPQLTAKDAELVRTKQLLAELELNSSKQTTPPSAQEEPPSLALLPIDHNLSLTNLLGPDSEVADDGEAFLSNSELGKVSESLANLLQPELRKGSAALKQRGNRLTLALAAGELFPPGDATVTIGGASLLERIGVVLHGFRYQNIEVAGHTDNQPLRNDPRKGFRDNAELSRTRADHAVQVLVSGGLGADRIKAVGYADSKPIATNDTENGRSRNRRMEIVITQWPEPGGTVGDGKAQAGKKPQDSPVKR